MKNLLLQIARRWLLATCLVFCPFVCLTQSNLGPPVSIDQPTNGEIFHAPTNINIAASVTYGIGPTNVEFFANGYALGAGVLTLSSGSGGVYALTWSNAIPGNYTLTAVGTNATGTCITSAPVNILVESAARFNNSLLTILTPTNGEIFLAPTNVKMVAAITFAGGPTNTVFFANGNVLGRAVLGVSATLGGYVYFTWTNPPPGNYTLTAVGTNGLGTSITSTPVNILVKRGSAPPVVTIVATDPVAIAGTNFWVWPGQTNLPVKPGAGQVAASPWHTNLGPKTAAFTVRRAGPTNEDLVVDYNIGGTASNGVDYAALPSVVTIPASQRQTLITIVPSAISDLTGNKTVVLTLQPSTNVPPDYILGLPWRAAALISGTRNRMPATGMTQDGDFHFSSRGPEGAWFSIQYSTNLVDWTAICTNPVINGSIDFIDSETSANPARFYRAVPLTNSPAH